MLLLVSWLGSGSKPKVNSFSNPTEGVTMCVHNKLSDRTINNFKPNAKKYKVGDGDKLWLAVFPTGAKSCNGLDLLDKKGEEALQ